MEEVKRETEENSEKDLVRADLLRFAALSAICKEPLFKNFAYSARVIGINFVANDFTVIVDDKKESYRLVIVKRGTDAPPDFELK